MYGYDGCKRWQQVRSECYFTFSIDLAYEIRSRLCRRALNAYDSIECRGICCDEVLRIHHSRWRLLLSVAEESSWRTALAVAMGLSNPSA